MNALKKNGGELHLLWLFFRKLDRNRGQNLLESVPSDGALAEDSDFPNPLQFGGGLTARRRLAINNKIDVGIELGLNVGSGGGRKATCPVGTGSGYWSYLNAVRHFVRNSKNQSDVLSP